MKAPPRLQTLVEEGLIDTVVRQLMSGKEAMVFVVRCGDETRCAKIYKEATHRSFRQAVDYTENRKVKTSRSARARAKGSTALSLLSTAPLSLCRKRECTLRVTALRELRREDGRGAGGALAPPVPPPFPSFPAPHAPKGRQHQIVKAHWPLKVLDVAD
jgi:hypothetical protein